MRNPCRTFRSLHDEQKHALHCLVLTVASDMLSLNRRLDQVSMLEFWAVTSWRLVGRWYQRFGWTHCLQLQGWSDTTQKTNMDIFTAVKTSNLMRLVHRLFNDAVPTAVVRVEWGEVKYGTYTMKWKQLQIVTCTRIYHPGRISGSHGGEYEDCCLLGFSTV
jgi:hypothetical protein